MKNEVIVCKFGGTSVANADQIRKVGKIVESDRRRKYVVVSAPAGITDLLIRLYEAIKTQYHPQVEEKWRQIVQRFVSITQDLRLEYDIQTELQKIEGRFMQERASVSRDWLISRGEYLNGLLVAKYLNFHFVCPSGLIFIDQKGQYEHGKTFSCAHQLQAEKGIVVPGFYGTSEGKVKTFSRGGSDLTGSIVAALVAASVYENWTDVAGVFAIDPKIVPVAPIIPKLTRREMRELAYRGAKVLHDEAVIPLHDTEIPIFVRNTNAPEEGGTFILPARGGDPKNRIIGIAGQNGFSILEIEKSMMNAEIGFMRTVTKILARRGISIEHTPGGVDNLSFVLKTRDVGNSQADILSEIKNAVSPDRLEMVPGIALIAIVGQNIHRSDIIVKAFSALQDAGIEETKIINQGGSKLSLIIGVKDDQRVRAITALYSRFKDDFSTD